MTAHMGMSLFNQSLGYSTDKANLKINTKTQKRKLTTKLTPVLSPLMTSDHKTDQVYSNKKHSS